MEPVLALFSVVLALPVISALLIPLLEKKPKIARTICIAILAVNIILLMALLTRIKGNYSLFEGAIVVDKFSILFAVLITLSTLIATYGASPTLDTWHGGAAFYSLALLALTGVYAASMSGNILTLLSAWILSSIASYTVVALAKDPLSVEGAAKYAVMGSASSTLLFLGVTLFFAITSGVIINGKLVLSIEQVILAATVSLLASIGFKMGVFPFQGWLPDTYGGSHPSLIALVSGIAKCLAIVTLLKFSSLLSSACQYWLPLIALLSILTMFYGNLGALVQESAQRLLAYSSIAHAGYLLVGFAALSPLKGMMRDWALAGLAIHFAAYSIGKAGAFLALTVIHGEGGVKLEDLKGLGKADPWLAGSFTVLLLSLMGMPPLIGFWGKLFLFASVVFATPWLTLIALLNTAISVAYYVRIIKAMYFEKGVAEVKVRRGSARRAVIVAAVLSLVLGLGPIQLLTYMSLP